MERALSLPELLEDIFLNLDMTTLLVSVQRVNKTWNTAIAESPALQKKLFFRPISSDEVSTYREHVMNGSEEDYGTEDVPRTGNLVFSPLLVKKFGSCFFDFGTTYGFGRRAESFYALAWSPGHYETVRVHHPNPNAVVYKLEKPAKFDSLDAWREHSCRKRFTAKGASWRRMLVSQPPPPCIGYVQWESDAIMAGPEYFIKGLIHPQMGEEVKMGMLYDLVQYQAGHHDAHSAWFRVVWGCPQDPFETAGLRQHQEQLFYQTTLAVELRVKDDRVWADHPRDPINVGRFDKEFRSEEFDLVHIPGKKSGPFLIADYMHASEKDVYAS